MPRVSPVLACAEHLWEDKDPIESSCQEESIAQLCELEFHQAQVVRGEPRSAASPR